MKVSSVNYSNNFNRINNLKGQNFTGLWGKTSLTSDIDPALGILRVQETSYYYPFKDENERAAEVYVQGHKNAYIEEDSNSPRYIVNDCRLCATLPFTESQYEEYLSLKKGTKLSDSIREIHRIVQKFYLFKTHGNQKSAVNINLKA